MNEATTPAAVETKEVTIVVGKETKEVVDAVSELIADLKAKKDMSLIAMENLPGLLKAVEGVEMIDDEMKSQYRNATVAYSGMKVADALLPQK